MDQLVLGPVNRCHKTIHNRPWKVLQVAPYLRRPKSQTGPLVPIGHAPRPAHGDTLTWCPGETKRLTKPKRIWMDFWTLLFPSPRTCWRSTESSIRMLTHNGEQRLIPAQMDSEQPQSVEVIEWLYHSMKAHSPSIRAAAVVADVSLPNEGDGVRIDLEHRDGVALSPAIRPAEWCSGIRGTQGGTGQSTNMGTPWSINVWPVPCIRHEPCG